MGYFKPYKGTGADSFVLGLCASSSVVIVLLLSAMCGDQWTNAVIEMGGIHAVNQYGLSAVRGIRDGLTGHHDSLTSYEKMQTITQHPLKDKYADLESTASHVSSFLFLGILCSMTTMALSLSVWPYYRFEYTHRYITVPACVASAAILLASGAWLVGTHGLINNIETHGSHEFHVDIGGGWCFEWTLVAFLVSIVSVGFAFRINLLAGAEDSPGGLTYGHDDKATV